MDLSVIWQHPLVQGVVTGALAAAAVDFAAFKSWKSFDEFTRYDWKTAVFRWSQGAAIGVVTALSTRL